MRRARGAGAAALGLALSFSPAAAQTTQSGPDLRLSGYARTLVGGQDLGYDVEAVERRSVFTAEVLRLKWLLEAGPVRVNVHNRLQALATSGSQSLGVLGFGVSAAPTRTVDLSTEIVSDDHVRIRHDIDRLSASLYVSAVDVTIGRQAITWGIASLFPVADLWAQFSPFELDTEEKPGVDAVRALFYPGTGIEVDAVLADRGSADNLSAGVRATIETPIADLYVGVGKFWREAIALAGASFVTGSWKIRSEIAVPRDVDADRFLSPRVTAGVDWIGADVQVSVELHHNGLGSRSVEDYAARFASAELQRGETYYVGRYYAGAFVSYRANDRLSLSLGELGNLTDPSFALLPGLSYDLGQRMRLGAGGLLGLGAKPTFAEPGIPTIHSEFGTYGHFAYAQAAFYF